MTLNAAETIRKMMGWCPLMSMKDATADEGVEYGSVTGTGGSGIYD